MESAQGADAIEEHLHGLTDALASQISAILQALAGHPKETSNASTVEDFSAEQQQAVLRQLATMLANDDAKAERLIGDNTALLMACMPNQFRELRQAVREYDFEQALALLPTTSTMPASPDA
jgi:two-component system sensor histidine kinase/response regulator